MIQDFMSPQPSLEGGNFKPAGAYTAPIVNSVDHKSGQLPATTTQLVAQAGVDWLGLARNAYDSSDTWMNINVRATWSRNFAHYRSEHAADSPIMSDANKHKANYFWPKTRTLVRAIQAAAAAAYFTSSDVVALEAEDQDDKMQGEASNFMRELINYRLANTIPWYQTVLGGIADAAVLGTVVSHQSWVYTEDENGNPREDKPKIRIVPAENIRISPAADWIDPANSSPYFIELIPMFLGDVQDKINAGEDTKSGEPAWKDVGTATLLSAGSQNNLNTTAKARAGQNRLDPKISQTESVDAFRVIWIHRNIVRHNGVDWLYYTAGTMVQLTDPVRLESVIPWANGKRDYVMGCMEVETDRTHPSGPVELVGGLQKATNELKNQRYDNVRQVLNRRYLYRAGSQVDVRALGRNVPGGLIGISAPGALGSHVEPLNTPDVTGSSYQEEDRISLAMDDLSGSTTGSTVNSNRKMNETVGGMQLMQEAGNAVREMELRTVTETWMVKALTQLVQMLAMYETDETAMLISAKKAKLLRVLPEYFDKRFTVKVNVGMGAVSPTQRMQKITSALTTVMQLIPDAQAAVNGAEIAKEVFGAAGFDNGSRFFDFSKVEQLKANPQKDPQIELAEKQLQAKSEIESGKLQIAQGKLELENAKLTNSLKEMEAKISLLIAQTATANVTAIYEATQAAGVIAQNPGGAPISDEILASAGFQDHNAAPVVPTEVAPAVALPENTHPNLPAKPATGAKGILKGIETPRIEP